MKYGYARVSTEEQKTHAQTDALQRAGCDIILEEKRSGGSVKARPILLELLKALRPGDGVYVYKNDRISRSLKDLLWIQEQIEEAGATFTSLTEAMDTNTPAGRLIFQMVGVVAEFERAMIRERTTVGLRAAMARGAKPGAPRSMKPEQETEILELWATGRYSKAELARRFCLHISSVKRLISRAGLSQQRPVNSAQMMLPI